MTTQQYKTQNALPQTQKVSVNRKPSGGLKSAFSGNKTTVNGLLLCLHAVQWRVWGRGDGHAMD